MNIHCGKPVFACVLKSGGDFVPMDVQALQSNIRRFTAIDFDFICLSDLDIPGVKTYSLDRLYSGWWSMVELFRIVGPVVVTGLDTIFTGPVDGLFRIALDSGPDDFWMIRAFARNKRYASGIMAWNGDWSWLYKDFDYGWAVTHYQGEQDRTIDELKKRQINIKTIQDEFPGIYSFKHHCQNELPEDARAVLFHGKPRPRNARAEWIKDYYGGYVI